MLLSANLSIRTSLWHPVSRGAPSCCNNRFHLYKRSIISSTYLFFFLTKNPVTGFYHLAVMLPRWSSGCVLYIPLTIPFISRIHLPFLQVCGRWLMQQLSASVASWNGRPRTIASGNSMSTLSASSTRYAFFCPCWKLDEVNYLSNINYKNAICSSNRNHFSLPFRG